MKVTPKARRATVDVELELEDAPLIERVIHSSRPPERYQPTRLVIHYWPGNAVWALHVARMNGDRPGRREGKFHPHDFTTEPGLDHPLPAWVTELVEAHRPTTLDI